MKRIMYLISELILDNIWPFIKRICKVYQVTITSSVVSLICLVIVAMGSNLMSAILLGILAVRLECSRMKHAEVLKHNEYTKKCCRTLTARIQELEADVIGLQSQPLNGKRIPMV